MPPCVCVCVYARRVSTCIAMLVHESSSKMKLKKKKQLVHLFSPIRLAADPTGCLVVVQRFLCGYKGVVLWL